MHLSQRYLFFLKRWLWDEIQFSCENCHFTVGDEEINENGATYYHNNEIKADTFVGVENQKNGN